MGYYLVYIWLKTIALLPLCILYVFSDFIYIFVYHVIKYRLFVVRQNLKNAFPEANEKCLRAMEKGFYHHMCDVIVETVKLLHISDREVSKRIRIKNGEVLDEIARQGQSVILLLGHFANWEWVTAVTQCCHISTLNGQIYRPLRNKLFDRLMLKIRSRFKGQCIPQKQALRVLLSHSKEGLMTIGFISDQRPRGISVDLYVTFLNQRTRCGVGAEFIAQKLNAHLLYVDMRPVRRGYYEIEFKEIDITGVEGEYPYTQKYMAMLEEAIRKYPTYWLWSHNRWTLHYRKKRRNLKS